MKRTEIHLHISRKRRGLPDIWSVRPLDGHVRYETESALVAGDHPVRFAVQPAGRRRWLDSGVRNVHAYVRGYSADVPADRSAYVPVRYDLTAGAFLAAGRPVIEADAAYFAGPELGFACFALNPR